MPAADVGGAVPGEHNVSNAVAALASGDLLGIPVLLAACPTAMLVTALCLQYDRSDAFASKCIFINTILSAATIPLVIWLLF